MRENHLSFSFTNNIVYFSRGVLIGKKGWEVININSDRNIYWDTRTRNIHFLDFSFDNWKKTTRKDKNSIIADPLFRGPDNYDFRFRSRQNIKKINFIPFDYSQAGVYGSFEWKKKAILDPKIVTAFNESVERRMKEEGISK